MLVTEVVVYIPDCCSFFLSKNITVENYVDNSFCFFLHHGSLNLNATHSLPGVDRLLYTLMTVNYMESQKKTQKTRRAGKIPRLDVLLVAGKKKQDGQR